MKKFRSERRRAVRRLVEKRTARALRTKWEAYEKAFNRSVQPGQLRSQRRAWQRGSAPKLSLRERRLRQREQPLTLVAPKQFSLTSAQHRTALLRFLADLKRLTLELGQYVLIDFRGTQKMFPEGTLLFAAELDVIHRHGPPGCVRCNRPTSRVLEQLLQQLGLATKMKRNTVVPITADNVRYWRVKSDTLVDGSHTESLINEYKDHFSEKESAKLYEGLTEAMTNAKQHAYAPAKDGTATEPRWWMFSQMRDGKLSVSFCDLGMGFKNSLLSGENWAAAAVLRIVDAVGLGRRDANFIKAAFALGKTRTKEPHRGKGLEELKKVIESVGGRLSILSHKGMYFYSPSEKREDAFDFEDTVPGTVISWHVNLPKGTKS